MTLFPPFLNVITFCIEYYTLFRAKNQLRFQFLLRDFERNYQIYRQSYVHSANSPISWHYPANPSEIACYPSAKICVRAPMRPSNTNRQNGPTTKICSEYASRKSNSSNLVLNTVFSAPSMPQGKKRTPCEHKLARH